MSKILVTGMSGTGKSSALAELGRRGYRVVDTDDPGWREYREYVEVFDEVHASRPLDAVVADLIAIASDPMTTRGLSPGDRP